MSDTRRSPRTKAASGSGSVTSIVDASTAGRSSERTRELILDAAHDCIIRFGIRRTSMQEVARYAKVSRGLVYRYFADKDSLVKAVVDRSSRRNMDELEAVVASFDRLDDKVVAVASWIRHTSVHQLFFNLSETEPERLAAMLTTQSDALVSAWIDFWVPQVKMARDAGEVRPNINVRQASEWLARILLGLVSTRAVTFDADNPRQLRKYIRDHAVAGLR
jgi:AcrR family transcriptional regulator